MLEIAKLDRIVQSQRLQINKIEENNQEIYPEQISDIKQIIGNKRELIHEITNLRDLKQDKDEQKADVGRLRRLFHQQKQSIAATETKSDYIRVRESY